MAAGHRADLGEPGVAAELVAPPRLHRPGDAEHGRRDEAEDVARHRQRQHERPATARAGRGSGGRRRATPARRRATIEHDDDADRQHDGRDDLVGQAGLPLLAPDRRCSGAGCSSPAWRSARSPAAATTTGASRPTPAGRSGGRGARRRRSPASRASQTQPKFGGVHGADGVGVERAEHVGAQLVAHEVGAERVADQRLGLDGRVRRVLVVVGDERVLAVGRQPLEELLGEGDVVGVAGDAAAGDVDVHAAPVLLGPQQADRQRRAPPRAGGPGSSG